MSEYITMRDCLKLDLKDAIAQRDEARAWSARWKSAAKDWRQLFRDFWRRKHVLAQELNQVREDLDEEMKFHHRTHGECVLAQCALMDARAALQRITESDMRWSKKIAREALEAAK